MEPQETSEKLGVKIERPNPESIGLFFIFLAVLSLMLIGFSLWLLVLEWLGQPLPGFLKLPVF
ncbi:MAG: hypothetical protein HYS55_04860 [Candidatus Omnitrophica bacterium]|nr:hypothetical protein [Candidatus Omnitrophota bacterium]